MPRLHYPTVIISDAHLGKDVAQADMLHEFLEQIECDTLYLLGDIIDGWHLMSQKHKKFDEMHARVLDSINRKADQGTDVIYIAGNHDENLRARWNVMQRRLKKPKNKKGRHPILNRTHVFSHQRKGIRCPIRFINGETYQDPAGRSLLLIHGDQFDWKKLKTRWGQILSHVGDKAYDGLIKVNGYAVQLSKKYQGTNFSIASYIKKKAKSSIGIIDNYERAVAKVASKGKVDGIICGHIHYAEIRDIDGAFYANSGDWVESATALVHDEDGNWEIIDWIEQRADHGLSALPCDSDPNPNAEYRAVTEKQLRWIQRLWPARNFDAVLARVEKTMENFERVKRTADEVELAFEDALNCKKLGKLARRLEKAQGEVFLY